MVGFIDNDKSICYICFKPISFCEEDGWLHDEPNAIQDHEAKPLGGLTLEDMAEDVKERNEERRINKMYLKIGEAVHTNLFQLSKKEFVAWSAELYKQTKEAC